MLQDRISELVEMLYDIEYKLREQCHKKGCIATYQCPREHTDCRDNLNTQTAIAWECAIWIHSTAIHLENDCTRDKDLQHCIKNLYNTVTILGRILSYHDIDTPISYYIQKLSEEMYYRCISMFININDFNHLGHIPQPPLPF